MMTSVCSDRQSKDNQLTETSAIAVSFTENNTREIKALIVGPPDTPYGLGFYQVSL